jgi:diguanylate cyclase (GGDEF)-like protein/PAS domain S-box-containing protein
MMFVVASPDPTRMAPSSPTAAEAGAPSETWARLVLDSVGVAVVVVDRRSRTRFVSHGMRQLFGDQAPVEGERWLTTTMVDEDVPRFEGHLAQVIAAEGRPHRWTQRHHLGGETRHIEWTCADLSGTDAIGAIVVMAHDVSDRVHDEAALRAAGQRLDLIVGTSAIPMALCNIDGLVTQANEAFLELVGAHEQFDVLGRSYLDFTHPDDPPTLEVVAALRRGEAIRREAVMRRLDGSSVPVLSTGQGMHGPDGTVNELILQMLDLGPQRTMERRMHLLFAQGGVASAVIDSTRRVALANAAFCELYGRPLEDVIGQDPTRWITRLDVPQRRAISQLLATGSASSEYVVVRPDGSERHVFGISRTIVDERGEVVEVVSQVFDVTELKLAEAALARQASTDPLTGLANRLAFTEQVGAALASLGASGRAIAIALIDVDHFTTINETLGHDAGDDAMLELAQRFTAACRPGQLLARFAGDEFAVMTSVTDGAAEVSELVDGLLATMVTPIRAGGTEVHLTASAGISVATTGSASDLLRDADVALSRAKSDGRARVVVFDRGLRTEAIRRLHLDGALRRAIEHDELVVHYQPEVDLRRGVLIGVEALVRWRHPRRGLVAAGEFIPFAEARGLVVPIGERVLRDACRTAARWLSVAGGPEVVRVNLSGRQLREASIVDVVRSALDESGLPAGRLCLEVTESVFSGDAASIERLRELRDLGVVIAVDDFGVGWSSLSHLRRMPAHVLKIDASFIEGLGTEPTDAAVVSAIVHLASALGLEVTAEGVETPRQLDELLRLGCERAQGWLFARAVPAEDVERLFGIDLRPGQESSTVR